MHAWMAERLKTASLQCVNQLEAISIRVAAGASIDSSATAQQVGHDTVDSHH